MSRLLRVCLLAYPRARRRADGDYLVDLALELAERSNTRRQAVSLLRGGLLERVRGARRHAVLTATVAVLAASSLTAGGLGFANDGTRVEVQSCTGQGCGGVDSWAAGLEQRGWRCDRIESGEQRTWHCTRS